MRRLCSAAIIVTLLSSPLAADPFIEALETAIEAYRDGDLQYAEDELIAAQRVLAERKAAGLAAFLPEPPEGWTREIDTEAGQMLAFMGGGTIAKADYSGPDGSFELTLMADNPFVAQFGMMLGNAALVAQMGGQVERINRVRFMREDNSLKGMVGTRVLVQAEGAEPSVMIPFLEQMDFRAIESF